jgi:helicase MOV-10
MNNRFLIPCR